MIRNDLPKLLSLVENRGEGVFEELAKLYRKTKGVPVVGITGPPGSGKSTLVDQFISLLRKSGKNVGVLAIDPSSPFSGGALLGDRLRMQRHAGDDGVFIRSLGSRGARGGLSRATRDFVVCLDAYGFDEIFVETVGVGQTELDVMGVAKTTIVVLTPESGDAIQTLKAGLIEIADIFAINKEDRPGAKELQRSLVNSLGMNPDVKWKPPVLLVQGTGGKGVEELWKEVEAHRETCKKDPGHQRREEEIRKQAFLDLLFDEFRVKWLQDIEADGRKRKIIEGVARGLKNPYEAISKIKC